VPLILTCTEPSLLRTSFIRFLSLAVFALVFTAGLSGIANAHVSKSDAGTAVLMHIIPDDVPQAGVITTISLSLSSDSNTVTLPDCNCQVTLLQNGKVLSHQALSGAFIGAGNEGIVKETFPEIGVYDLQVQGASKTDHFKPFSITYPIRVATASLPAKRINGLIFAGCLVCSLAILCGLVIIGIKVFQMVLKK
jgi:hypothetical protein